MIRRPPRSTLFPSPPLFRSRARALLGLAHLDLLPRHDARDRALSIISGDLDDRESPDRKSTRLNSSHQIISYAVFCLKKKKKVASNSTEHEATHIQCSTQTC